MSTLTGRDVEEAMNVYRKEIEHASLFLLLSDDVKWIKTNLDLTKQNNSVIVDGAVDHRVLFAMMSNCDGAILTIGSYGLWAAVLSNHLDRTLRLIPKKYGSQHNLAVFIPDYAEPKRVMKYLSYPVQT
jgi:hypothetical protein